MRMDYDWKFNEWAHEQDKKQAVATSHAEGLAEGRVLERQSLAADAAKQLVAQGADEPSIIKQITSFFGVSHAQAEEYYHDALGLA